MTKFNQYEAQAKTFALSHLVLSAIAALLVGVVIGAVLF